MKKVYLVIVAIAAIANACTKQPTELTTRQESQEQEYAATNSLTSTCYGDTWEATNNFVGNTPAVSVVYQNKVYYFNNVYYDDIFNNTITTYDGTSWSLLTSAIPFDPTYWGFAFVIDGKAYIGTTQILGANGGACYEYDFESNTWTLNSYFPGTFIIGPAFFGINKKGYVLGSNNETWEFNPAATIKWRRRANYPGPERYLAQGFSINGKGYFVNGNGIGPVGYLKSLYEYDPANNSWTLKASFPGAGRERSQAFVISSYGYVGGGNDAETRFIDFYRYDADDNKWLRIADYNSTGILHSCFAINSRGYAVWNSNYNAPYKMKKYTPRTCLNLPQ